MEDNKEKFYTVDEVAEILSVNKVLIFKLIRQGKLPAMNIGSGQRNVYRITVKDINNLKDNKKEDGKTRPT